MTRTMAVTLHCLRRPAGEAGRGLGGGRPGRGPRWSRFPAPDRAPAPGPARVPDRTDRFSILVSASLHFKDRAVTQIRELDEVCLRVTSHGPKAAKQTPFTSDLRVLNSMPFPFERGCINLMGFIGSCGVGAVIRNGWEPKTRVIQKRVPGDGETWMGTQHVERRTKDGRTPQAHRTIRATNRRRDQFVVERGRFQVFKNERLADLKSLRKFTREEEERMFLSTNIDNSRAPPGKKGFQSVIYMIISR